MSSCHRLELALATVLFLAPLGGSPAVAQIPDEFTNLKLLDPEIEKEELVLIMRDWAGGLGVRCNHCHVGPENLRGMDFATDEKATKRTARRMLEMTRQLNGELLAGLPTVEEAGRERARAVSCYTCHRGLPEPPRRTLHELTEIASGEGVDAAVATFRQRREEHAETGRYDLRTENLFHVARRLLEAGQADAALEMVDALLELSPEMGDAYALRAQIEIGRGRLDVAEKQLALAREVEPDARLADWVERLLERARTSEAETTGPERP